MVRAEWMQDSNPKIGVEFQEEIKKTGPETRSVFLGA
jgi:hypothetical protein